VLDRRLSQIETLAPRLAGEESLRSLLDRMISMTRGLFPAVSDLAREVRYRYFDQPLFERTRKQVYAQVEDHLAYLAANPEAADRQERVRELVECPQPLVNVLCGRFATADAALQRLMLEAITRRYYRIRTLIDFRTLVLDSQCFVSAEYDEKGKRVHLFTAYAEFPRLSEAARGMVPLIEGVPADHDVVIDFYLWHSACPSDPAATQQDIHSMLNQAGLPSSIRRVVAVVVGPGSGQGMTTSQSFTYRPAETTYEE
jgi:hypothetical protein